MSRIDVAHYWVWWQDFVNTVTNLRFLKLQQFIDELSGYELLDEGLYPVVFVLLQCGELFPVRQNRNAFRSDVVKQD
jgi:hypothetical protein